MAKCKHKKTKIEKGYVFNDGYQFIIENLWKRKIPKGYTYVSEVCKKCGKTISEVRTPMKGRA